MPKLPCGTTGLDAAEPDGPIGQSTAEAQEILGALEFHPTADFLPMITNLEFENLVASIAAHGQRELRRRWFSPARASRAGTRSLFATPTSRPAPGSNQGTRSWSFGATGGSLRDGRRGWRSCAGRPASSDPRRDLVHRQPGPAPDGVRARLRTGATGPRA
jgi:hypothetical protein